MFVVAYMPGENNLSIVRLEGIGSSSLKVLFPNGFGSNFSVVNVSRPTQVPKTFLAFLSLRESKTNVEYCPGRL